MSAGKKWNIVISCEHAGAEVPPKYDRLFKRRKQLLAGHRGYDAGALSIAKIISRRLGAPLLICPTTRLLIDVNSSPTNHRKLFSELSRRLSKAERRELYEDIYLAYHRELERIIEAAGAPILHLSVHSFTPVLDGRQRKADIGILYDPSRSLEKLFASQLKSALEQNTHYTVRRNYPYLGISDGVATILRRSRSAAYLGIELEISRKFASNPAPVANSLAKAISDIHLD